MWLRFFVVIASVLLVLATGLALLFLSEGAGERQARRGGHAITTVHGEETQGEGNRPGNFTSGGISPLHEVCDDDVGFGYKSRRYASRQYARDNRKTPAMAPLRDSVSYLRTSASGLASGHFSRATCGNDLLKSLPPRPRALFY